MSLKDETYDNLDESSNQQNNEMNGNGGDGGAGSSDTSAVGSNSINEQFDHHTTGDLESNQLNGEQSTVDQTDKSNDTSTKKRKHDTSSDHHSHHKRSNRKHSESTSEELEVYLKIMIPSSAAGGVIGRGGEKIAQIQKDANVRMKMSKANDYYPNTNERVCLIMGSLKSVLKAHDYIEERVHDKTEHSSKSDDDRSNIIRVIIPNTTAGLLIGKGGAYIKQIKDESGAFVQISTKQTDLPERVVTIESNEKSKRDKALFMVVKKVSEDPQHTSCPNLNYSSQASNLSHSSSSEAPYGQSSSGGSGGGSQQKFDFNSAANYLAGLNNLALLIVNCGGSFQMTADSLKAALRNTGYSSSATMEIIDAITVLMSYGLITKVPPTAALANSLGGIANLAGIASLAGLVGNNQNPGFSGMGNGHAQQQYHHHHHSQHQHHQGGHSMNQHHGNMNGSSGGGGGGSSGSNPNAAQIGTVLQMLSSSLGKR